MRKNILIIALILILIPFISSAGNNWLLHFSDGTTKINGTDVCLNDGTCMTDLTGGGSTDGNASSICGDGEVLMGDNVPQCVNLNSTIDSRVVVAGGATNYTFNNTQFSTTSNYVSILESWLKSLFYTKAEVNSAVLGNVSAGSNETGLINSVNNSLQSEIANRIGNDTYYNTSMKNYVDGQIAGVSGGNASWNESYAKTLFTNQSYVDTENSNQTSWIDATFLRIANFFTKKGDGIYLYNDTNTMYLNETKLNNTIDYRISLNNTGASDTQKKTNGFYLYNDTDTIYFNDTQNNATILLIASQFNETSWVIAQGYSTEGGNASWNESYADTLYSGIQWGYNQSLATFNMWNSSWDNRGLINSQDIYFNESISAWVLYVNGTMKNYVDGKIAGVSGDNSSWNESMANDLYVNIDGDTMTGNLGFDASASPKFITNGSANFIGIANLGQGLVGIFQNMLLANKNFTLENSSDDSVFNIQQTGDVYIGGNLNIIKNITSTGIICDSNGCIGSGGNSSWNESYANTLYQSIGNGTFKNITFDTTGVTENYISNGSDDFVGFISEVEGFIDVLKKTLFIGVDLIFESALTDETITLKANEGTIWANSTINSTTDVCIEGGNCLSSISGDNSSWNESYAKTLFTNQSYVDSENTNQTTWVSSTFARIADMVSAITGNITTLRTEVNSNILGNWTDLDQRKLNVTDGRYNETDWVNSNFYNKSDVNANILGNASSMDYTNVAMQNQTNTFAENQVFSKNISQGNNDYHCFGDNCDAYIYYNGSSLIMGVG